MTFPEGDDITGKLGELYSDGKPAQVPGNYRARMTKETGDSLFHPRRLRNLFFRGLD